MNSRLKSALIGGALAIVMSTVSSQAATIVNGSFENGVNAPTGVSFTTLGAGSTNITGWTVGGNSIDWINQYWQPADGQRSLDLSGNGAGSIEQSVTGLTVGQTYRVSFYIAGNDDGGDTIKDLIAAVIGNNFFSFDVTGTNNSNMGWLLKSFDFVAGANTELLKFTSQENNPYGAALDNVSISAVPVPAALPLFATALTGMGLLRWRRRRNV